MRTKKSIRDLSVLMTSLTLATSQAAMANSSDSGTLTAGQTIVSIGCGIGTQTGFVVGSIGSYSPTGLTAGKTIASVYGVMGLNIPRGCTANGTALQVSGFSANPGSSWLISIACNGITDTPSTAAFAYDSGSGTATWAWGGALYNFGLSSGAQVSCTIVHS